MNSHRFIEELVPKLNRNASVVDIAEAEREYCIAVAGTTTVVSRCHVPRDVLEGALHNDDHARRRLETFLKEAVDDTVAAVPDGRA
jgi:hypothetical protein